MKKIEVEDLKRIQLEILDYLHAFCMKNNIKYWIDSGTLLGAVRHKGYIPWDDDIDVGMLREDYDRFLKEFNESNERYKCYSIENNPDFLYPFAKVLDTDTILYEPDEKGEKLSVNIDVFPYDRAPEDAKALAKMYKRRNKLQKMRRLSTHHVHEGGRLRRILIAIISLPFKLFPKGHFEKKIVKNALKYRDANTSQIGDFTCREIISVNRSVFDSFVDLDFEGRKYKAPVGYDTWLKAFYGDYMQLPPEDKRVSEHNFKAFYKE